MRKQIILYLVFLCYCHPEVVSGSLNLKPTSQPIQLFSGSGEKVSTQNLSPFITPHPKLRYNQSCFLCSHNSFFSDEEGYQPYNNQKWSIKKQLNHGIRAFMLSTFTTRKNTNNEVKREKNEPLKKYIKRTKIRLCIEKCEITPFLKGKDLVKTIFTQEEILAPEFLDYLKEIEKFLKENPNEIVTIFLENYVDNPLLDFSIQKIKTLPKMILKPKNWNPYKKKGWPTIGWMQDNRKRLIIFNSKVETKYKSKFTFPTWQHVQENRYGTININEAQEERSESSNTQKDLKKNKTRHLLLLNFFPKLPIPTENINDIPKFLANFEKQQNFESINSINIELLVNAVYKNKFFKNRLPNFIALNFVNKGNAMAIVNRINQINAKTFLGISEQDYYKAVKEQRIKQIKEKDENLVSRIVNNIKEKVTGFFGRN